MDQVVQNIQENTVAYVVIAVCLLPVLYLTRRWTGPVLMGIGEIIVYSAVFHLIVAGLVRFFAWFREASSFQNVDTSGAVTQATLTTPLTQFWDRALYKPSFLFWVEVAGFVAILYVVIWIRPTQFASKNKYKGKEESGSGAKGGGLNKTSRYTYARNRGGAKKK